MELNLKPKRELNPAQILVLGFAVVILLGGMLLNLPFSSVDGISVGFVNAIFTATSAVCVTGLAVVDTGTHWTLFGKIVILVLIQIGGLGFMTMATAISFVMGRKISLKSRLVMQEAFNQSTVSGIVRLTQYVLGFTLLIEGVAALLLMTRFIPMYGWKTGIFFGIFHSVSAFCNAGFDLVGNFRSLMPFVTDPVINITIMALIIIGGLGFGVVTEVVNVRKFKKLSLHSKVVISMTIALILAGFVLILLFEYNNPDTFGGLSWPQKILAAFFQSVTPRTAGFNTVDMAKYSISAQLFTIILMFIGGSPGSTAGGIKTTTFGLIIAQVVSVIIGKEETEIFKKRIPAEAINKALALFSVAMFIVLSVTMILSITETGHSFMDLIFETTSAFATVGLSLGVTPTLSIPGKLIIALTMFAGRLGPLTLIMALASRQAKKSKIRYPEGKILVG